MKILIREYKEDDLKEAAAIWNQVVEDGKAFPQTELLTEENGAEFFREQSFTGVAIDKDTGRTLGLYILHPNNVGRCGHICNASYAVRKDVRGQHIGEKLVKHSMKKGKDLGFGILQFNAVVASNTHALHLYERLGFVRLGKIPGGFLMKDGSYEDIIPHYYAL
ncbi:MAG TPA: GNAT family N-acetyltransferase [Candidatus Mediterraneibacter pullistercoris]|nr:GNAT family N-acetyltransferase [Candidatus Mediterraneibacter pullistercoris]